MYIFVVLKIESYLIEELKMKKLHKLVWGVIGAGNVCEVKSVPGMYKTDKSEVKMVMRRDALKAADFALRHHIPISTDNADMIFADPDINIVYVATPPDSHCEYALRAAAAGKAVYVEKPMALDADACEKMIVACREAEVPLFVAYYRRALPGFLRLKELIETGAIGEVRFVTVEMHRSPRTYDIDTTNNWRVVPLISGGGHFHDLASHQFDYLDFLFGKITETGAISKNQAGLYPAEDIVTSVFTFESGVVGNGLWCFTTDASAEKEQITIVGSKGRISFNTFGSPMKIEIVNAQGARMEEIEHPEHIQQPLIKTIVDELCGKKGHCYSRGESGKRTTEVLNAITANYKKTNTIF